MAAMRVDLDYRYFSRRRRGAGSAFVDYSVVHLHRLRDSVGADEAEVDIHEERDQRRKKEHVDGKESLQGGRPHDRPALENLADEFAELWRRGQAGDLDGDLGREVGLLVPGEEVAGERERQDQEEHDDADHPVQLTGSAVRAGPVD